jgi:hypothetical protein
MGRRGYWSNGVLEYWVMEYWSVGVEALLNAER